MLQSNDDLREWVNKLSDLHAQIDKYECSCGWKIEGLSIDPTWEGHYAVAFTYLADVLPSRTGDGTNLMSWTDFHDMMWEMVDEKSDREDAFEAALEEILVNPEQASTIATNALRAYRESCGIEPCV